MRRLALLGAALLALPARGGTFWRVADPGPSAPAIHAILGDAARTIALDASGPFERTASGWRRLTFRAASGVPYLPLDDQVFFASGRFHAALPSAEGLVLARLDGETWSAVATLPAGLDPSWRVVDGRLHLLSSDATGPRHASVALGGGPVTPEAPPPGPGTLYVLSGRLWVLTTSSAPTNLYRLDGTTWTPGPPVRIDQVVVLSSANALWLLRSADAVSRVDGDGETALAGSFPVGQTKGGLACSYECRFVEAGGQTYFTASGRGLLQLRDGAFRASTPPVPFDLDVQVFATEPAPFLVAGNLETYRLADAAWKRVEPLDGARKADRYVTGAGAVFALRGRALWRREPAGWRKLADPPDPAFALLGVGPGGRPVVSSSGGLLAWSATTDRWEGLGLAATGPLAALGEDLYVANGGPSLFRYRAGSWTSLVPGGETSDVLTSLAVAGGNVYAIGYARAYRVDGDALVPAFADLPETLLLRDVAATRDGTFLRVLDIGGNGTVVVRRSGDGRLETLVTDRDIPSEVGDRSLIAVGDDLVLGPYAYANGTIRRHRGEVPLLLGIDRSGLLASAGALLVPVPRVRKTLPVVVDTTGAARYRSRVLLANHAAVDSVARLVAGAGERELDVPLAAGAERWLDDPFPGFVGPVAVDFDGLDDEREAAAFVRVFSPSGQGTAGTSLTGVDAGLFSDDAVLLAPAAAPGSRAHLALAGAGDGPGRDVSFAIDGEERSRELGKGAFLQLDPPPPLLEAPVRVRVSGAWPDDDLVGYVVRNDAVTNDGAVVPFDPPIPAPARRTRLLPAVVSLVSPYARYRTELSLARRPGYDRATDPPGAKSYRATYRAADGSFSRTFPIALEKEQVLRVDDAGLWLRENGVPVEPGGVNGTLLFSSDRPEGAADLLVTAVVSAHADGAEGEYGVGVPVVDEGATGRRGAVSGLVEDDAFRTNLAVVNAEGDGGPDASVTIALRRAVNGTEIARLGPYVVRPGARLQLDRVLAGRADSSAWAEIESTGGRITGYGVLVDNATGDGTLIPMARAR